MELTEPLIEDVILPGKLSILCENVVQLGIFLTLLHNANEIEANWHNEIQHSWFTVHLQKSLYFLVFHRNIGLKTSTYEFTDRIHQKKQGFEGKKLSRKEFVAFEDYRRVCVVDMAGSAILTVSLPGISRLSCLLSSRIL